MALTVGSRLGHYDVTALIGEGGMGQVYQATDTKLNRQVALKILPEAFATDPDRLARFQREAQVLASLNHPNIAAIHGLEESDGTRALVLELVEGPTLADRIAQGPIPVDEALPIAKQIAEALEAAHEAGVIHRDLKPANIKVKDDGTVKVLDFGLAKALDTTPEGDPSQSPTLTAAATQMGVIMGTAAYMSPEQARGKTVDRRADIWSFGAVLFEMLTGQRAFQGVDVSTTLADVIRADLSWEKLPSDLPSDLATYLRRCLEKDPHEHIRDIGDVRLALDGAFGATDGAIDGTRVRPTAGRWRFVSAPLAVLLVGALAMLLVRGEPNPSAGPLISSTITVPSDVQLLVARNNPLALSPDGNRLVYAVQRGSTSQLYLRHLGQFEASPIPGTEGGTTPFFSPDGRWVGFVADGTELRKVLVEEGGGASLPIGRLLDPGRVSHANFVWGADDTITAGWVGRSLLRVQATGGELEPIPGFQYESSDVMHGFPQFLPGEEVVLVTTSRGIELLEIETGQRTLLLEREGLGTYSPRYAPSGHLVYGQRGNLNGRTVRSGAARGRWNTHSRLERCVFFRPHL